VTLLVGLGIALMADDVRVRWVELRGSHVIPKMFRRRMNAMLGVRE